ncbi:type VI secretion protein [Kitasatospora sp. NPDC006786]|uniref:type VI secretion protein n=1 Tax=unclassified Kitasatospora TaxID=2633591 RepID=UPI0033C92AD0
MGRLSDWMRRGDTDLSSIGLPDVLTTGPAPVPAQRGRRAPRRPAAAPPTPLLGWPGPHAGRAVRVAAPEVHRCDTHNVSGLYPFGGGSALPPVGAYIGHDILTGRQFSMHPGAWVQHKIVSNPAVLVTGTMGAGKSALIKALSTRLAAFGVKVLIAGDVKGEYGRVCRWLGCEPLELGPGLPGRINPLDAGSLGDGLERVTDPVEWRERLTEIHRRRLSLLCTLLELQMRRPLTPEETEAISAAIKEVTGQLRGTTVLATPTLRAVHAALRDPTTEMARELRIRGEDIQATREATRASRAALATMLDGHVGDLFSTAETSPSRIDWSAPMVSIDISRTRAYGDETVAMIMMCISSWTQAAIDQPDGPQRLVVRDELWRALQVGGATVIRKLDSDLRLHRADGVFDLAATHRLSDFEAVGAAGSEAAMIAQHMVSSFDTKITMAQDAKALGPIRDAVGLTDPQVELISGWGRAHAGRGLWMPGRSGAFPVQLHLTEKEKELYHTDERMAL